MQLSRQLWRCRCHGSSWCRGSSLCGRSSSNGGESLTVDDEHGAQMLRKHCGLNGHSMAERVSNQAHMLIPWPKLLQQT